MLQGQKNQRQEEAPDKKKMEREDRNESGEQTGGWQNLPFVILITTPHEWTKMCVKFYQFIKTSAVHISSRQKDISLEEYLWLAFGFQAANKGHLL